MASDSHTTDLMTFTAYSSLLVNVYDKNQVDGMVIVLWVNATRYQ
jgi:hypothetical protein